MIFFLLLSIRCFYHLLVKDCIAEELYLFILLLEQSQIHSQPLSLPAYQSWPRAFGVFTFAK